MRRHVENVMQRVMPEPAQLMPVNTVASAAAVIRRIEDAATTGVHREYRRVLS